MSTFDKAVGIVMSEAIEGGHSYDKAGGDTWYGIARNFYKDEHPWPPTRERAKEIYREDYWDKFRCGEFPEPISIALFDAVVNQAQIPVIKELQLALRVEADGIIGPATIAAAAEADPQNIYALFCARRAIRYATVSLPQYQVGLIARLFRVQHAILTTGA